MDQVVFDRLYNKGVMCCEFVIKLEQYTNIIVVELNRLNNLQLESNQLLDNFYEAKNEFDFLINDMLQIKYVFLNEGSGYGQQNVDISNFLKSVWQIGKQKFLVNQKKLCFLSAVGCPLEEVLTTIKKFIQEVMHRITYMPYHSKCTKSIRSMCSQITQELQEGNLKTADACYRQCSYLNAALPFLKELNSLVHQYISQPNIFTPKQFVNELMFQIPSIENIAYEKYCKELEPFYFLVDLLNGKLLNSDFLDQHSDIRPIVDDDSYLKKSRTIKEAVIWIVEKAKIRKVDSNVPNLSSLIHYEQSKKGSTNYMPSTPFQIGTEHIVNVQSPNEIEPNYPTLFSTGFAMPMTRAKFTRKSRKSLANHLNISPQHNKRNDLQPINLHAIQTPLLPPLI